MGEEYRVEVKPGQSIMFKLVTLSTPSVGESQRNVFFECNGHPLRVMVDDLSATVVAGVRRKADRSRPGEVPAPVSGALLEMRLKEGDEVKQGDPVCV